MSKVAIVGLGYVGLPLALLAETKGFDVIGIDLDEVKLDRLNSKKPIIDDDIANKRLQKSKVRFTDSFEELSDRDIVVICVPTPVDERKMPDLSLVKNAVKSCSSAMKQGSLLVIESTINPGVCDEIVIPLIENGTKHKVGKTIYVAHCPERINPGDPKWHVDNINRVLGADSEKGLAIAFEFYSKLIDAKIKKMSSIKEAEAVKIVENTFRDVNIAFVNELAMSFSKMGINAKKVIDGAATKPFAFMPHYPGIGIGGHCIPVDPYYLIEYARGFNFEHEFLSLARSINESMPVYTVDLLEKALIEKEKMTLRGAKVAVLGLSYKPDVGDDRESPAYKVIETLSRRGAVVTAYDPYLPGKSSEKSIESALDQKHAVILVTAHDEFKKLTSEMFVKNNIAILVDGRNIYSDYSKSLGKHGIIYIGIGA